MLISQKSFSRIHHFQSGNASLMADAEVGSLSTSAAWRLSEPLSDLQWASTATSLATAQEAAVLLMCYELEL